MKAQDLKAIKTSGILIHPSSLSGSSICGSFGSPSRKWIHSLARNGVGVWQFLPLGPTDSNGSPYSSPSSFALNPWFLDVEDLISEGFLDDSILKNFDKLDLNLNITGPVDFNLANLRIEQLKECLIKSWSNQKESIHIEFEKWCLNQFWLQDFAIFMELRRQNNNLPWWEWPDEFTHYNKKVLTAWSSDNKDQLLGHKLLQWHLDKQWKSIKHLARQLGVLLFGDIPFYVSRDSSDVWSNRRLFSILENGDVYLQSGVPPDYFSDTGQLWGNPVYRWSQHRSNRYLWWKSRIARQLEQVDILRIDHFRAFDSFWAVPGSDKTAENGYWLPSPGLELLNLLRKECGGELPFIAEDLGIITSSVEYLRDHFKLPGMKVLHFAFDGNSDNPYLPDNIKGNNWVVYTGTHDNSTTVGWWKGLNEETQEIVEKEFTDNSKNINWNLIETGMKTEAKLFISPIQDLLSLDDHARLNKPGTISNNWSWRVSDSEIDVEKCLKVYGELSSSFGR